MTETDAQKTEHLVQNIALGRDAVTIQCTDGTTFNLSVGDCERGSRFHITDETERVVEEGTNIKFILTYGTTLDLSRWAREWPG